MRLQALKYRIDNQGNQTMAFYSNLQEFTKSKFGLAVYSVFRKIHHKILQAKKKKKKKIST